MSFFQILNNLDNLIEKIEKREFDSILFASLLAEAATIPLLDDNLIKHNVYQSRDLKVHHGKKTYYYLGRIVTALKGTCTIGLFIKDNDNHIKVGFRWSDNTDEINGQRRLKKIKFVLSEKEQIVYKFESRSYKDNISTTYKKKV